MQEQNKKGNEIPSEQLEQVNGGKAISSAKRLRNESQSVVVDQTPSGGSTYLPSEIPGKK